MPAELFAVWYNTGRGFNSIAYYIMPHTLRKASEINLAKDVTRELIAIEHALGGLDVTQSRDVEFAGEEVDFGCGDSLWREDHYQQ